MRVDHEGAFARFKFRAESIRGILIPKGVVRISERAVAGGDRRNQQHRSQCGAQGHGTKS